MKCPECGAENPEHAFYCGRCSAGLREEARSTPGGVAERNRQRGPTDYQPRIPGFLVVAGALYVVFGLMFLSVYLLFRDELSQLLLGGFFLMAGVYSLWMYSSRAWRALHRLKAPALERRPTLAEVRCLNLVALLVLITVVCALLALPTALHPVADAFDRFFPYLTALILVVVFVVYVALAKPVMGIEEKGVFIRTERDVNEIFIPFSAISRLSTTDRIISVVLKDSPLHLRFWYYFYLGDSRAFRGEIDRLKTRSPAPAAMSAS